MRKYKSTKNKCERVAAVLLREKQSYGGKKQGLIIPRTLKIINMRVFLVFGKSTFQCVASFGNNGFINDRYQLIDSALGTLSPMFRGSLPSAWNE